MKNRRLVILLSILAFIVFAVIVSSTVFSFNEAQINFMSTTNLLSSEEEIVSSAEFDYGQSIFFIDRDLYIENLEINNPYLKVVGLEVVFPNRVIIHAVERDELMVFKLSDNTYAICDKELKVLEIKPEFVNTNENAMLIENEDYVIDTSEAILGTKIDIPTAYINLIENFAKYSQEWDSNLANVRANIEGSTLNYERENQLLIKMRQGLEIVIKDANLNLSEKLQTALSVYDAGQINTGVGILNVIESEEDGIVVFYNDGN
jgi:cell division septal protein FtsQ